MTAPAFGDRVKLKVTIPGGPHEPKEPGEIGLVVRVHDMALDRVGSRVVEVIFEGEIGRSFEVPIGDVTTDLDWATPRDAAVIEAYSAVLRSEGVGQQQKRLHRISKLLLTAHAAGLERYEARQASRAEREAELALQASTEAPEATS